MPVVPADNPMTVEKVALGRRLFFDPIVSENGRLSCASCHQPALAYTDGNARPRGARGDLLPRSAPSLANVAYGASFGWADARVTSLEAQMQTPLRGEHPVEMGLAGRDAALLASLAADPAYRAGFAAAFPDDAEPLNPENLVRAIACFERTLISGRSGFDRYVFDDDRTAMSDAARRGMALFYSRRAGCGACHSGITLAGAVRAVGQEDARAVYARTGVSAHDAGLAEATGRAADRGRFKVPTLRNVALTAPYMHDGSIATLAAVVEFYDRGGRQHRLRPLGLGVRDKADLLAFLSSLTDPQFIATQSAAAAGEP